MLALVWFVTRGMGSALEDRTYPYYGIVSLSFAREVTTLIRQPEGLDSRS